MYVGLWVLFLIRLVERVVGLDGLVRFGWVLVFCGVGSCFGVCWVVSGGVGIGLR